MSAHTQDRFLFLYMTDLTTVFTQIPPMGEVMIISTQVLVRGVSLTLKSLVAPLADLHQQVILVTTILVTKPVF